MIDIKDINGNVIQSVIITQNAERVIELMKADYVQLSWSSDEGTILPAGAYIEYKGEKFSLLEPYTPEQKDELEYEYKPQFQSKVMAWGKTPLFLYTQTESGIRKETDWVLTDNPANFMSYIADALYKELGEQWNFAVSSDLAASATITFSTSDIYSALNAIANAFETEWWVDKEGYTIHLGKCQHGNAIDLEVGVNVKTPSITRNKEGYFTRFYAFGSTRNIEQDYEGANANNIVNKRLTLDPTKYPQGYKDIREGLKAGEIFSKVLIFDDIYPSSKLSISNVRVRLLYRLDDDNNKVQVGTDSNGNPIYDQYAIWYFQIPNFTYDKESVIEGLVPSINFKTGALAGREFEIIYHDKDKEVTTTDGEPFKVLAGDYEICFIEEGTYIIPSVTGLTPTEGDEIVLFNIKMPEEYKQSAYDELEEALDKEIARMNSDLNTYQLQSDAVAFYNDNPNLTLGQKVRYTNGAYSFETRVMKLVTKLDYECEQAITIGNEKIKGNTEQLKEEVVNANTNINFLAALNETTNSLTQAYQRTQKMMMEGFASIKDMWLFDENDKNTIYSKFNIYSLGYVSAKGANHNNGGNEGGATTLGGLRNVAADADRTYDVAKMLVLEADSNLWTLKNLSELVGGLDEAELAAYLTNNNYAKKSDIPSLSGYATEQWVLGKGYLTEHQDLSAYAKKTDIPTIPTKVSAFVNDANYATTSDLDNRIDALVNGAPQAYDTLKEIADVLANNINSIDDILTALGTKVSKDDFNTAITNVNKSISDLNTELDLKLDAVTFTELFEKVQLEDGTYAIKAKLGLFSDGFISAKGSNVGGTSSEGGAVTLYQLNDVLADGTQVSGAQNGAVFVYDATIGKWKGVAQSEIVPNLTGYATESWVLSQGFLTQHQDLSDYAKLTDIPTIPTTDINKGVTAYGWGDHSKVGYLTTHQSLDGYVNEIATSGNGNAITSVTKSGKKITFTKGATYLTGITSKLVTDALGYTPYDVANFTKANIKSTLGISDWALASSKPSYTTKEVAEDTNLYFTNARAVAALKSITDGLQSDVDTKLDASVFSELFEKVTLEGGVTAIRAKYGLFTDYFLSAKGANSSGGSSSGGGLITSLYRYADLGKTFADTNNDTFNAYTINKINTDLGSRISALEGKATNVSFTQSLTSGTQIGTITIDGASKNIYAPTIPTKLSQFTDDVVSGKYLSLGGGTITGHIVINYTPALSVLRTNGGVPYIRFGKDINTSYGELGVNSSGEAVLYSYINSSSAYNKWVTLYHSGNTSTIKTDLGLGTFAYKSSLAFADLTNKPTTLGGYGITDWRVKHGDYDVNGRYDAGYYMIGNGSNAPTHVSYGSLLVMPYRKASGNTTPDFGTQIFLPNGDDISYPNDMFFRTSLGRSWNAWQRVITDNNYTSYTYSQSTIDTKLGGYLPLSGGTIDGNLSIGKTNNTNYKYIQIHRNNKVLEITNTGDLGILDFSGAAFSFNSNGAYWNSNTLIHSGNIGSQSVDNADKLDGYHAKASNTPFDGIPVVRGDGVMEIGKYIDFHNDNTSNNDYDCRLDIQGGNGNIVHLPSTSGILALLTSNVASATKLQTARTIWGQSFDGTGDVNGVLTINSGGYIVAKDGSGANRDVLELSSDNTFYLGYGAAGAGGNTYLHGTNIMFRYGTSRTEGMRLASSGNVLIGKTTDSGYKLDVNGTLHASGAVTFDSALAVGGAARIDGNVGIGNGSDGNKLYVYGVIRSAAYNAIGYNNAAFVFDKLGYHYTGIGANMVTDTIYFGACGATGVWVTDYYQKWHFNGEVYAKTGVWSDGYVSAKGQNTSSDMRLKNVLNEVVLGVKDIANAPSMRFSWKNGGGVDVGSSAQYWQGLLPDAVKERDGMLEMQYANIALLSAIAIAKNVETHEERIARLEKENKELRNEIMILKGGNYA